MKEQFPGKCCFCKKSFSRQGIWRHLPKCKKRDDIVDPKSVDFPLIKFYTIRIWSEYDEYWTIVDMPANGKFISLDRFLRSLWLECCDHLSDFYLASGEEVDYFDDYLTDYFEVGDEFRYVYDFGSTSRIKLKVVHEFFGTERPEHIRILSVNDPPNIECDFCDNPAVAANPQRCYAGYGYLFCKECAIKYECSQTELLPVVNSPRMMVCGYSGGRLDDLSEFKSLMKHL